MTEEEKIDALFEINGQLETRARSSLSSLWWLSFADDDDDDGFRGVVIIEAPTFLLAVFAATLAGINPHGQCAGREFPPEIAELVAAADRNRLYKTREELEQLDARIAEAGLRIGVEVSVL